MSARFMSMILFAAATLVLVACQQQSKSPVQEQAPAAVQPAPAPAAKPETPATTSAKPETPASAPKPAAPVAMTPKPSTPAAETPSAPPMTAKPAATASKPAPKPEASSVKPVAMSMTASTFSTDRCKACHAIDHVKVGPAWKDVVKAYGNEQTLAKVFESGFAIKDRKIASTDPTWKAKAGLMTMQYQNLIKGHGKEAAHALFMTVKNGKFGSY